MDWANLLQRASTETGACAGAVWQLRPADSEGGPSLQAAAVEGLTHEQLVPTGDFFRIRQRLLAQVLQSKNGQWEIVRNGEPSSERGLAFLPMLPSGESPAILELHFRSPFDAEARDELQRCSFSSATRMEAQGSRCLSRSPM